MLSPKMQRGIRVNEAQLLMIAERAYQEYTMRGYLYKRAADSSKWQQRWFLLYQNLLFYYDSQQSPKPSGVVLLEGCLCERLITPSKNSKDAFEKMPHCFAVYYRPDNVRQYELRAETESDCKAWIEAIREASYSKLLMVKVELEQKHLHLVQIVEAEKTAKYQYAQQCDDLAHEIRKLRTEMSVLKKELQRERPEEPLAPPEPSGPPGTGSPTDEIPPENIDACELRKIKKVQGLLRGWLCRRRWKQIVDQYIKSPHAENMRQRNSLVFRMVEAEEEYVDQMESLVSCFLRPFKMAASSKKPPCSHEEVNSIFLNAETVLFLHQIFLKGLTSRLESWPTLVLGDLFDMLLPMLSIYQEYVRNHHYSVQVLTESMKNPPFAALVHRLEEKPACQGRSLATFLTYPMNQVPRYVTTLTDILAHTPHDHVELKSLRNAKHQLEELSRQMYDEVSETENLRKNLAVERMIVEGCDILLDVNQVFIRQGTLIQVPRSQKSRFKCEKEAVRQCFLFSNHLIITTRASSGRLHLVPDVGKLPLNDSILIEDPSDTGPGDDDESSTSSMSSQSSGVSEFQNKDFKIVLLETSKSSGGSTPTSVHLVAPTLQEKAGWISDINQCIDNVHFHDLLHMPMSDTSSVTMPHSIKNDPKLFKDSVDIRFSKTLNSCKVPQIRYATPERLLERLTDLRFLSIDFLNTFLLTYRVFTDGVTVLEALKKVFYAADPPDFSDDAVNIEMEEHTVGSRSRSVSCCFRRVSQASDPDGDDVDAGRPETASGGLPGSRRVSIRVERDPEEEPEDNNTLLKAPQLPVTTSSSTETLTESTLKAAPSSPGNLSSVTLVPSTSTSPTPSVHDGQESASAVASTSAPREDDKKQNKEKEKEKAKAKEKAKEKEKDRKSRAKEKIRASADEIVKDRLEDRRYSAERRGSLVCPGRTERSFSYSDPRSGEPLSRPCSVDRRRSADRRKSGESPYSIRAPRTPQARRKSSQHSECMPAPWKRDSVAELWTTEDCQDTSIRSGSIVSTTTSYYQSRRPTQDSTCSSHGRNSFQHDPQQTNSNPGVCITAGARTPAKRRHSNQITAIAFAIATCASSNPRDQTHATSCVACNRKESALSTAATMRVLNVLRHWILKHSQDFEGNEELKNMTINFLDDIMANAGLLPAEHKAASQLKRFLSKEPEGNKVDLNVLLAPPLTPSKENIDTLSALEIAEQMTYLDHQIFVAICREEFLNQAWIKSDKNVNAPRIEAMTRRFNEMSALVVSEIVRHSNMTARVAAIEKWAAVADIARVLHNFNGVLQICAAFNNNTIFRLRKTWEKVNKNTRQTIDKLQAIVSSECRFRNLREALHRCDPPCIPYLGMYLTDLSFIEESTQNYNSENLLNFSKMRSIAHVIREIRHFQQVPYKIGHVPKVTNYLQDPSLILDEDERYRLSLEIEPRQSRLSCANIQPLPQV